VEKWSDIISELSIDLSKPLNRVTAKQIKRITNEEPRLMAKIDTREDLPSIFRAFNVFLLPISRSEYVIVRGEGYHDLETINERAIVHQTSYPFPISALDAESESIYLDYAHSCGLLSRFAGTSNLHLSFRGRRTTPHFSFGVNEALINVEGAQIEIDAVYENIDTIVTIEGKVRIPLSFNIKQIFYPYRTFYGKKPIRSFFFCYEPYEQAYFIYEYDFDGANFESIKLRHCSKFNVQISKMLSLKDYQDIQPTKKLQIPQADDVNKILEFPFRVHEGHDTSQSMVDIFGFVQRQSSYYRQAAEILGLLRLDKNRYDLTDKGLYYIKLPEEKKASYICKLLVEFPIMHEIFLEISIDSQKEFTKQDIIQLLRQNSNLTGSTLIRRAQTIISWFKWIRNNLGMVEVDKDNKIRISRQMKLS
jgi:hypothetical protein